MKLNVNGAWKSTTPFIKVNGKWEPASIGWVKKNGKWEQFYRRGYTVNITDTVYHFNLWEHMGKVMPSADEIFINILPGGTLSAYEHYSMDLDRRITPPAFTLGNPFTGKKITIVNKGEVYGAGGPGGEPRRLVWPGEYARLNGKPGGTCFDFTEATSKNVILINSGRIWAGGGGGGVGGSVDLGASYKASGYGQAGEGGYKVGGRILYPVRELKDIYKNLEPRKAGYWRDFAPYTGRSGVGGVFGEAGQGGTPATGAGPRNTRALPPGRGGRGGYSIEGIARVTLQNTGSIKGTQV